MNRLTHFIFLFVLVLITVTVFMFFLVYGKDYYVTPVGERHSHVQHELLKPSGFIGHGAGIAGSLCMLTGVFGYMARKRIRRFGKMGYLKHWLEFHIFLCSLGPVLVLYHTSFKFGGIVAISFWSMAAVVISGIIGRFIYLQIPRSIEGRELSLAELNTRETDFQHELIKKLGVEQSWIKFSSISEDKVSHNTSKNIISRIFSRLKEERTMMANFKKELRNKKIHGHNYQILKRIFRAKIILNRRIAWLTFMQDLFRYWHVAHLPFALIMLVIMIVHVFVAVFFGYTWIF